MLKKRKLFLATLSVIGLIFVTAAWVAAQSNWDVQNWRVAERVGIGTDTPDSRLDIDFGSTGSVNAGTPLGNGPGWIFYAPNGHRRDITGWNGGLYINASPSSNAGAGTTAISVGENGNVGIGMQDLAPNILTVRQNSPTDPIADAWTVYSSETYKEDIRELSEAEYQDVLESLLDTDVVYYRYKGQASDAKEKIGVIAEEVPSQILAEGNARAVNLNEYISILHAAIKAQQTQIAIQEEMIGQLQLQMEQLTQE